MGKNMRAQRSLFVVAVAITALGFTASANAQSTDARNRARQLYGEAQALFDAGNYSQAEASFRAAYAAVPNPVVLKAIASAQERQGNIAGAISSLEEYLRLSPTASDRAEIEVRLQGFRARPALVTVSTTPPGAQIILDGADTGHVTPHQLSMPAGQHTIELRMAGHAASTQTFDALAATQMRLDLNLDAQADPMGTGGGDQQAAGGGDDGGGGGGSTDPSAAVWALAGVGAATLVAGTVFGFLALSEQSNFDSQPTLETADRGEIFAAVADISFGVAGAAILAAIIVYIVERGGSDSDSQAALIAPFADQHGGGLVTQLRF